MVTLFGGMALPCRQLESNETHDIPDTVVDAWKQAVKSRSRAAKNHVFQCFLKAGKDWTKFLGFHICNGAFFATNRAMLGKQTNTIMYHSKMVLFIFIISLPIVYYTSPMIDDSNP